MKITIYFSWQIGIMITYGQNYFGRKYLTVEIPFYVIQIYWFKPPKKLY